MRTRQGNRTVYQDDTSNLGLRVGSGRYGTAATMTQYPRTRAHTDADADAHHRTNDRGPSTIAHRYENCLQTGLVEHALSGPCKAETRLRLHTDHSNRRDHMTGGFA